MLEADYRTFGLSGLDSLFWAARNKIGLIHVAKSAWSAAAALVIISFW
jgi:hypothetical protein